MEKILKNNIGQAMVALLFISVIGLTIISAAAIFVYENILSSSNTEQGAYAYYIAESGIEEGILRLLRNPNYPGTAINKPLLVGDGNVVISTSSGGIITAIGTFNKAVRKIQVKTVYNNGALTIQSWREVK